MLGETLGLSALSDSVFPAEAALSHADLGLEEGNSHSRLSARVRSPLQAGRVCWGRQCSERPHGAAPGHRLQAGSRCPHSQAKTSSNTLSLLGREALDTIYYYHSLDLEENHLAVPSGPSAGFTHPDLS